MGLELKKAALFQQIDYLIPVPLHPKREYQRGYNQSEIIARGMRQTMAVPVSTDVLFRNIATSTQTKKNRGRHVGRM